MKNPWLEDLERKVEAAIGELTALREENASLRGQLKDLRKASREVAEGGWEAEREEVRERVGRLVETLEETLGSLA